MPILRRLFLAVSALAVAAALVAVPGAAAVAGQPDAVASKKKGAKKPNCKKGYVAKKVTKKNGKKVWKCVKKPVKACRAATASCTPPPPPACGPTTTPRCLFPDPGKTLEEAEAREYLKPYLPNSTFTDCVTGWPSCGGFENRYSHSSTSTFYQCWLRPTSGSDVKSVGEYEVRKAKVNPDGSWLIQEIVAWYGHYNLFEWQVTDAGVVTGANQSDSGGAPEQIGPLQYVPNVAKDCSY
jgi:hypothetical protein